MLLALKKFQGKSKLIKDFQGLFDLVATVLNPFFNFFEKELNCIFFIKNNNINNRQLNKNNSGNNFGN